VELSGSPPEVAALNNHAGETVMTRHAGWVALLIFGIALGSVVTFYRSTQAQSTTTSTVSISAEEMTELVENLKDIGGHVKEINELLHKGSIKVVVIINADKR
jgi:hypothetical protein